MNPCLVRAVLQVVMALAALIPLACGGAGTAPARTALTPIITEPVQNPIELNRVTEDDATGAARQHLVKPRDNVGATELPRDPVSRLMTLGRLREWRSGYVAIPEQYRAAPSDTLVWTVQFEGIWVPDQRIAGPEPSRYAVVAVDSQDGEILAAVWATEPLLAPRRLRAQVPNHCVNILPSEARIQVGPTQAVELVRGARSGGALSKFGGQWEWGRADAQILRCLDTVKGVDYHRYYWFVTVPSEMSLHNCSTPSLRKVELRRSCWSTVATHLVRGTSGEVSYVAETEFPGPLMTVQALEAVQAYAGTSGWWSVWSRLNTFNDSIVPSERLAEFKPQSSQSAGVSP